jgi:predicted ester cyclase
MSNKFGKKEETMNTQEYLGKMKAVAMKHYAAPESTDTCMVAVSPDVLYHASAGVPNTLESWKQRHEGFVAAFGDMESTVIFQVAEGDLVFTYWTMAATHKGPFLGIPATGKRITMRGVGIDRVAADKVVEHWGLQDTMAVVAQIGGTPIPEPPRE